MGRLVDYLLVELRKLVFFISLILKHPERELPIYQWYWKLRSSLTTLLNVGILVFGGRGGLVLHFEAFFLKVILALAPRGAPL